MAADPARGNLSGAAPGRAREPAAEPAWPGVCALKVVYWGPGLSGKTSNLKWLHARLRPELRGRLVTLDNSGERTVYFDCLPLDLEARGCRVRLRLYTVPGQPRFRVSRRLVLEGADALVFVWDSRPRRARDNLRSLLEARETVAEIGLSWEGLPLVIQLNKADLAPRARADALLDQLGVCAPRLASVAVEGRGVLETLSAAASAALRRRLAAR